MSEYQSNPSEKIVKADGSSVCWFCWWSLTWDSELWYQEQTCLAAVHQSFLHLKVNQQMPQYRSSTDCWRAPDRQLQLMKWRQFLTAKLSWWCLLPGDDKALATTFRSSISVTTNYQSALGLGRYSWCKQFEWQEVDKWLTRFAGPDYVPEAEGRVPEPHLPVRSPEYSENRWHRTGLLLLQTFQSRQSIIICIIVRLQALVDINYL